MINVNVNVGQLWERRYAFWLQFLGGKSTSHFEKHGCVTRNPSAPLCSVHSKDHNEILCTNATMQILVIPLVVPFHRILVGVKVKCNLAPAAPLFCLLIKWFSAGSVLCANFIKPEPAFSLHVPAGFRSNMFHASTCWLPASYITPFWLLPYFLLYTLLAVLTYLIEAAGHPSSKMWSIARVTTLEAPQAFFSTVSHWMHLTLCLMFKNMLSNITQAKFKPWPGMFSGCETDQNSMHTKFWRHFYSAENFVNLERCVYTAGSNLLAWMCNGSHSDPSHWLVSYGQ